MARGEVESCFASIAYEVTVPAGMQRRCVYTRLTLIQRKNRKSDEYWWMRTLWNAVIEAEDRSVSMSVLGGEKYLLVYSIVFAMLISCLSGMRRICRSQ